MKAEKMLTILVLVLAMVGATLVNNAAPMGTTFTYQGQLMDKNKTAEGSYDFQFDLYDSNDPYTGTQLGTNDINDVDVIDGHFVVELDFGSDVFDGNAVWLETKIVRSPQGSDPAALRPLLELTPTPYAVYAAVAGVVRPAGGGGIVPRGGIIMWSGSINDIPNGWALCDGTNDTPDLRDRFIIGARQDDGGVAKTNVKGNLMQTGGTNAHVLIQAEMPPHVHSIRYKSSGHGTPGSDIFASNVSGDVSYQSTGSSGGGQVHENCPPFYALVFIMKT